MAASMKSWFYQLSNKRSNFCGLFSLSYRSSQTGQRLPSCKCLSTSTAGDVDAKTSLANAFKQASQQQQNTGSLKRSSFRTSESNPLNHTSLHEGLYYTVDDNDYTCSRYMKAGVHPKYHEICKAFNEQCVMVRRPATEIFQCIQASDLSLPAIRYVLYGRNGAGKTITMSHVMQHCGRQGWLVVHVPWVRLFVNFPKEVQTSPYNSERCDTPVECTEWLTYFQAMNQHIIANMTTKNSYTWSKREVMDPGIPFQQLVEFGFLRSKYAGDVMGAVLKEIKQQSSAGIIKTLVAVDGANSLWHPTTIKRLDNPVKKYVPEEHNAVRSIRKLMSNDWSGGAVVAIVDIQCAPKDRQESYMPRYILEKQAIDDLEPHIPIHVQNFNDKEASSCLQYFVDRRWIQRPEGLTEDGKKEILFLSSKNPSEMHHVCSRW